MDTRFLFDYITIYETKSLHKAADQLFMSQQGLSRILQTLEREYKTRFFERSAQGLIPTPAGDRFYEEACRLSKELEDLRSDIRTLTTGRSEIRIACAYGTMHLMYPQIQKFYREFPDIWIHWAEYRDIDAERVLEDQSVDLAFLVDGEQPENFKLKPLGSSRIMVLVYKGHRYFERSALTIDDLKGEKIIIEGPAFHIHSAFISACAAHDYHPDIVAETTEISLCHTLASMHEGLAIVVDFISDKYDSDDVRAIPLECDGLVWSISLGRIANKTMKAAVQKFWDYVSPI